MEVASLHALQSDAATGAAVERAKTRVADAERSYRYSRDRLAQHMINNTPNGLHRSARDGGVSQSRKEETPRTRQVRLERLAYQFWEDGGRYHGNAGADWLRAEAALLEHCELLEHCDWIRTPDPCL